MAKIVRSLGRNLGTNLIARALMALAQIAIVPVLLKLVGASGYGLVGVFLTLQAVASIFESPFNLATGREIAQARATGNGRLGPILQFHALAGILCGLGLASLLSGLATPFQHAWLDGNGLAPDELHRALVLMAAALGLQVAGAAPIGALLACDRQLTANLLQLTWAALRTFGAAGLAFAIGGGVVGFLDGIAVAGVIYVTLGCILAARATGWSRGAPSLQSGDTRRRLVLLAGMLGVNAVGLPLVQLDKVLLAHFTTLAQFGYYTLGANIAFSLYYVAVPVAQSSFPALAGHAGNGEEAELGRLFRLLTEFLVALCAPAVLVFSLFGRPLVAWWTQSAEAADAVSLLLPWLTAGVACNVLFYLVTQLQMARGRTRTNLVVQLGLLAPAAIAILLLARAYGPVGAAIGALGFNAAAMIMLAPLVLRSGLGGGVGAWFGASILLPLAGAVPGTVALRLLLPSQAATPALLAIATMAGLLGLAGSILAAPTLRGLAAAKARKFLGRQGSHS